MMGGGTSWQQQLSGAMTFGVGSFTFPREGKLVRHSNFLQYFRPKKIEKLSIQKKRTFGENHP